MRYRPVKSIFTLFTALALALTFGSGAATAAPNVEDDNSTPEQVAQVHEQMAQAGVAGVGRVEGTRIVTQYDLATEGLRATVVTSEPDPSLLQPRLRLGVGWNVYLYLNRVDQGAVATGGAAGLAVLACGLPGVNLVGCAAVTAALGVAAFYIATNGFCSNELEVAIPSGSAKCV